MCYNRYKQNPHYSTEEVFMADGKKKELFRKFALEQVKTPENLSDYIRVTSPSAWLLLAAAAIVLAVLLIWGFFGSVEVVGVDGVVQQMRPIEFLWSN
jgi:hypothetical protein